MLEQQFKKIILDFVHNETGYANPLRPYCNFEDLRILSKEAFDNNTTKIIFRYFFDEDGFSQYDKNHILDGMVIVDKDGEIIDWSLEEFYTGVGAVRDSYQTKRKNSWKSEL